MKNYLKYLVVAVVMLVCLANPSFAQADDFQWTDDFWGRSTDPGNLMGYEYIQNLMNAQGYSSVNAQNDYITSPDPFYLTGQGESVFTLNLELAGNANSNILGYYQLNDQGNKLYTQIFAGTDVAGVVKSATITGYFGLYLQTPDNNIWYTDRFLNLNDQHAPQGLVYELENNSKWMVAWEDLKFQTGDNDYQDMVVTVTATPEPAASALFLIGGMAMFALLRRKEALI